MGRAAETAAGRGFRLRALPIADGPPVSGGQTQDIAVWTGSRMLVPGLTNGAYNPVTNTWRTIARDPYAQGVTGWTGSQLLVVDGVCWSGSSNGGVSYTPATSTWRDLPNAPLQRRRGARGAWTGKELVVAGGLTGLEQANPVRTAAAYNPATDSWRRLPAMPSPCTGFAAAWTGRQLIVWGGGKNYADGAAYTPAAP
jgi:hypothetical protein